MNRNTSDIESAIKASQITPAEISMSTYFYLADSGKIEYIYLSDPNSKPADEIQMIGFAHVHGNLPDLRTFAAEHRCAHEHSIFSEDGLSESCADCGALICDHYVRKYGAR